MAKYVLDDNNNKVEAFDKEEVLAILAQAIADGSLDNITADSAFISKLKCCVTNGTVNVAFISNAKYNELEASGTLDEQTLYFITDDTTLDGIDEHLKALTKSLEELNNKFKFNTDENGVLKYGDVIIPQKKLLWSGKATSSIITLPQTLKQGDKFEIVLKFVTNLSGSNVTAITIVNGYVQSIARNAANQIEILVYTVLNKAKSTLNGAAYTDEDIKVYGTADSTGGVNILHIENASTYEEIKIYKIIE